jgi:hypothetical protein
MNIEMTPDGPLVVFDYGLGVGIHHTMYCEEIGFHCQEVGQPYTYFAPDEKHMLAGYQGKTPSPEGIPDKFIRRELSLNLYNVKVDKPEDRRAWRGPADAVRRDFIRILSEMRGGVVFIHTPKFYILWGLAEALRSHPELINNFDRLVLEITAIGSSGSEAAIKMMEQAERDLYPILAERMGDKFKPFAFTEKWAEDHRDIGVEFPVIPIMSRKSDLKTSMKKLFPPSANRAQIKAQLFF